MSYFTVHREDVYKDYKASPLSAAAIFQLVLFAITIGAPIALVAVNPDIWPMYTTVYEQPFVRYQQMVIVHLDLAGGSSLAWSTIPQYNRLMGRTLRSSRLKTKEIDINGDKIPDAFSITLDVPLTAQEQVFGFTFLVFFDFILQKRTFFEMSTVVSLQHSAASAGADYFADGTLRFVQKDSLRPGFSDYINKDPLVNISSADISDYNVASIVRRVATRNASTVLDVSMPIWTTTPVPTQPFHIEANIHFPVQSIWMQTTVLHRLTTAGAAFTFWLLPFWLFCWYLRRMVFSSGALFLVQDSSKYSMKSYFTANSGKE
ncbi:putative Transmembrane protein 231 [Hypsibius exemplaris]|uniref:Transmembrane protein 231 n=1 Tax=Hypsibius exemplaris TaxID=2072580 RepID=A0A1W0WRH3_HYPEX|nr:putative Transmembrane protein 231 [Hypsibius exemplaris]